MALPRFPGPPAENSRSREAGLEGSAEAGCSRPIMCSARGRAREFRIRVRRDDTRPVKSTSLEAMGDDMHKVQEINTKSR